MRIVITSTAFFGKTLSVSMGIAEFSHELSADQLIDYADRELYKAKALRRQQILSPESL